MATNANSTTAPYAPTYRRRTRAYIATGSIPPLPIPVQRHLRLLVSVTTATILVWGIA